MCSQLFLLLSFLGQPLSIGFDFGSLGPFIDRLADCLLREASVYCDLVPKLIVGCVGLETG